MMQIVKDFTIYKALELVFGPLVVVNATMEKRSILRLKALFLCTTFCLFVSINRITA